MTNELISLLIFILIGFAIIVFGNYKFTVYKSLIKTGVKTEGIVLSIESEDHPTDSIAYYHPVIRFTTHEKECITERYEIGTNVCHYKVGASVNVIYDLADNKKFIIDDRNSSLLGPIIMIVGAAIIVVAIVQYLYPFVNYSFTF